MKSLIGTIQYIDLEGGFWAIKGEDGQDYSLVNPPPIEYQQVGKRVYVQYRYFTGFSVRMWGRMIDVINYDNVM